MENCVLPKIMEINCEYLNFLNCNFSERSMRTKERGDKYSKEGTGRVYFHKSCDIIHCYTVEASYFRGIYKGNLPKELDLFKENFNPNLITSYNTDNLNSNINSNENKSNFSNINKDKCKKNTNTSNINISINEEFNEIEKIENRKIFQILSKFLKLNLKEFLIDKVNSNISYKEKEIVYENFNLNLNEKNNINSNSETKVNSKFTIEDFALNDNLESKEKEKEKATDNLNLNINNFNKNILKLFYESKFEDKEFIENLPCDANIKKT
jgi:hypothetical protein